MAAHPESLLAASLRLRPQSPERDAQIFWLAAKTTRKMLRLGFPERADLLIGEMRNVAEVMSSRLSARLRQTADDLDTQALQARFASARAEQ